MVVESPSAESRTEFRYSRGKVAGIAFITFLLGAVLLLVPVMFIVERPYDIFTPGGIVFFLLLCGSGMYVLLWGLNFFRIAFEVEERGLRHTTLFSKKIIPWEDIAAIKRVHFLGVSDRQDLASAPPDLSVHTKDGKRFYILKLMNDQDFDLFLSRIKEKTGWDDEEKAWQRDVIKKQGRILKVAGLVMIAFGIFFPRMYEYLQTSDRYKDTKMKIVDILVNILGLNGFALLFVGFGIFLLFVKPKIKNLKKQDPLD